MAKYFNVAPAFQDVPQIVLNQRANAELLAVTGEAINRHARLDDQLLQQRVAKLFARALSISVTFSSLTMEKAALS